MDQPTALKNLYAASARISAGAPWGSFQRAERLDRAEIMVSEVSWGYLVTDRQMLELRQALVDARPYTKEDNMPDECLDQLLKVRNRISAAIQSYQATGTVPDVICERFRKAALELLYDWGRAEENTARHLKEQKPLPTPRGGHALQPGEDP